MGANFLKRYRPADDHKPVQRGDRGEPRLWRLGTALAVSFVLGRNGVDSVGAGGPAGGLALSGELERRVIGAPDHLDGVAAVAQHAAVEVGLAQVRSKPRMIFKNARPPSPTRSRSR